MPLFMLVSGYAAGYSTKLFQDGGLSVHIRKRSLQLLLPWLSWSILSYFLINRSIDNFIDYFLYAIYHMESIFWFLFSLFIIDVMCSIALYTTRRLLGVKKYALFTLLIGLQCMLLLLVAYMTQLTFLGIKYTLYYLPFFLSGFLLKKYNFFGKSSKIKEYVLGVLLIVYMLLIGKYTIYTMPDSSYFILLRIFISFAVCLVIFAFFYNITSGYNGLDRVLAYASSHSLELYVVQCLVLPFVSVKSVDLNTIDGYGLACLYFFLVSFFSVLIISVINSNKLTRIILFGKNN